MSHERLHGSAVSGVEYFDGFVSQTGGQLIKELLA